MAGSKSFNIAAIPTGINKDTLIAKMRAGQALTPAERNFATAQYEANIPRIEDEIYPDGTDGRGVHDRTFVNGVSVTQLCQGATANLNLNLNPYEAHIYMRAYVAAIALARDSVIEYFPQGKHNSDEPNPQVRLDTKLAEKDLELEKPKKGFWRTIGEALRIVKPLPTPQEIYEQKMALDEERGNDVTRGTLLKESVTASENAMALGSQQAQQQQLGIDDIEVDDEPEQKVDTKKGTNLDYSKIEFIENRPPIAPLYTLENTERTNLSFADLDTSAMIEFVEEPQQVEEIKLQDGLKNEGQVSINELIDEVKEPFQAGQNVVDLTLQAGLGIEGQTNINALINEGKPEQKDYKIVEQKFVPLTPNQRLAAEEQLKDLQEGRNLFEGTIYKSLWQRHDVAKEDPNTVRDFTQFVDNMEKGEKTEVTILGTNEDGTHNLGGYWKQTNWKDTAALTVFQVATSSLWHQVEPDENHPEGKAFRASFNDCKTILGNFDKSIGDLNKRLNPPEIVAEMGGKK